MYLPLPSSVTICTGICGNFDKMDSKAAAVTSPVLNFIGTAHTFLVKQSIKTSIYT